MLSRDIYQASMISPVEEYVAYSRTYGWVWRLAHFFIGVILAWLPWTVAWENNLFLYLWPQLELVTLNPFFQGAVLGLGIVNMIIGIHDGIQARFARQRRFY